MESRRAAVIWTKDEEYIKDSLYPQIATFFSLSSSQSKSLLRPRLCISARDLQSLTTDTTTDNSVTARQPPRLLQTGPGLSIHTEFQAITRSARNIPPPPDIYLNIFPLLVKSTI